MSAETGENLHDVVAAADALRAVRQKLSPGNGEPTAPYPHPSPNGPGPDGK